MIMTKRVLGFSHLERAAQTQQPELFAFKSFMGCVTLGKFLSLSVPSVLMYNKLEIMRISFDRAVKSNKCLRTLLDT